MKYILLILTISGHPVVWGEYDTQTEAEAHMVYLYDQNKRRPIKDYRLPKTWSEFKKRTKIELKNLEK